MNLPFSLQIFGVDFFCLRNKFLVFNLVARNLKLKYRKSVLGWLWSLLVPLLTSLTYYFVFQFVVRISVPNYVVFVVVGILPWTFFVGSVLEGMESIASNFPLISKIPIPFQVFSFTSAFTNFVNFLLALPVIVGLMVFYNLPIGLPFLVLPYLFFIFFLFAYSFSLILAIGFVFFRDLRHLMGVLVQLWMYGTPILYPASMLPNGFEWVLYANPVAPIFVSFHKIILDNQWPPLHMVAVSTVWCVATMFIAIALYKRVKPTILESV